MCRRRRWPRADLFLLALLLWGTLTGVAHAASDRELAAAAALPSQRVVLAVTVNGIPAPEPVLVRRQGPLLWMRAADLRAIGVEIAGTIADAAEVALPAVRGLDIVVDDGAQAIALTQRPGVQRVRVADPPPTGQGDAAISTNGWGTVLNYDLTATRAGGRTGVGGLFDAVVYGPRGHFFGSAVATTARSAGQRRVARLDTGFTTGDPGAARRVTVGDVIAGATENSRPVRLGGVQVATDFDLRPDLVTFPVPAINGTAAVPSSLDLIVNGSRRSAGEVRAGQFAVTDVPVVTGVNTVTVAVRDALGREALRTVSTYVARTLLRPGLTAFSAEAGFVRTGYATAYDRYRSLAGSASLRTGLSDALTLESHLELSGRVGTATGGASLGLGRIGLLSASLGVSVAARPERHGGTQWAIGYERLGRPVSVAARYVRHSRGWYDLAGDGGAATRAHSLSATLGFDLGRWGSLGATVIDQGRGRIARPADGRVSGPVLPAASFASLSWSTHVARRVSLIVNAGTDLRDRRSGFASIGALLVLGRRSSAYAGALVRTGGASANAEWSQAALVPGDLGYRVGAARGGIDRLVGEVSYQGGHGHYTAQAERTNGVMAARVSTRGAVIVGGDGVLFADRLGGSFAIVDAAGQAGVPVMRDNHRIGVTDRRGKLVVANLPAYQPTKLAIDPLAVADSLAFDRAEWRVRPAARVGVPVRFGLRRAAGRAIVLLIGGDRAPVPVGSRASANGGPALPVGMDGELYLEEVRPANRVVVALRGGGACVATFPAPRAGVMQPRIGPVACLPERIAAN